MAEETIDNWYYAIYYVTREGCISLYGGLCRFSKNNRQVVKETGVRIGSKFAHAAKVTSDTGNENEVLVCAKITWVSLVTIGIFAARVRRRQKKGWSETTNRDSKTIGELIWDHFLQVLD